MKIKSMIAAAMIAAMGMAACAKDDAPKGIENSGSDQRVSIKISRKSTRAEGVHVVDDTPVAFGGGALIFTTTGYKVTKVTAITDDDAVAANDGSSVGIGALEDAGDVINAVPPTTQKVFMIGNYAAGGITLPAKDEIFNPSKFMVGVASQYKADGSVDNVTLFGGDNLTAVVGEEFDLTANFDIKPIVSRIEIGQITYDNGTEPDLIEEFTVDGIFINNYYNQMGIGGAGVANDLKDNGQTNEFYVADGGGSYTTALNGIVFDSPIGSGAISYTPTGAGNNVWAYNILTPTAGGSPEIIVCISGIKLADGVEAGGAYTGTRYLNLLKFFTDASNTTPLTFEQGNVYRIPNLTFDEHDLTIKVKDKEKKVKVEMGLLNWQSSDIGYVFN